MRTSLASIALLTAPLLAVVACQSSTPHAKEPLSGKVVEKEYQEPEVVMETSKALRERYTIDGDGEQNTTVVEVTESAPSTKKPACYRLAVRKSDGSIVDICNKKAYKALDAGDQFDAKTYGEEDR
jgi:hypothetical protein